MMLVVMRAKYGVMIYPKTSWIEGETQNIRADRLSRFEHLQPILGAPLTRATPGTLVMESLNWCNSISLPESGGDICKIWTLMRDWCHKRVGLQRQQHLVNPFCQTFPALSRPMPDIVPII